MDAVLRNARIYTSDENQKWADTLVISDDKIAYVGGNEETKWRHLVSSNTLEFDLKGKMIIPGIVDSHIHPAMIAQSNWHVKLPWTEDVNVLLEFVKAYAEKHPKEEIPFLYFEYYPTSMFGETGPTKELLDSAVSDRPCLCQDFGEHLHWVNTKMLELMEVDKNTPDPVPGLEMFVRDEEGQPTGWLKELVWGRFSEKLYENIGWVPPIELTEKTMMPFFNFLSEHGITAIADGITEGEEQLETIYKLDKEGKLKVYFDGIIRFWGIKDLPDKINEAKNLNEKYGTKHIKVNSMKLFLDGTNESGNSASLEPHINDPSKTNFGEIKMEEEELVRCFLLCNDEKVDMQIHVVGDRGFRVACNAVEEAQKITKRLEKNWDMQVILAHCEIVDPEDMERPAKLGITINWSCHWSGGYFGEEALSYFSKEKWERMYQFNPMIESGALVAFSSDVVTNYELHRADPFFGMQTAITRVDLEFPLDSEKYPDSVRPPTSAKINRDYLIKGYTINGARQLRWENEMGTIEVGKKANLNIISDDFFQVSETDIHKIKFETVIFDGEIVFGSL